MYHTTYPQPSHYLGTAGHRATSSFSYVPSYQSSIPSLPTQVNFDPHSAPAIAAPAPAPAPVEESNGGITSVLEYNINNMSTFLSWCSFGILKQNRNPSKEFDNLIISVLFATRLPKSTIIIALEYMNQRYSSKQISSLSESEIFTILIISLILANKFNDDNTFTNRSWCGAAGLSIEVVNYEEKEWLNEVKWQLNVVNFEDNIRTLEECWLTWLEKYTIKNNQPQIKAPSSPRVYNSSLSSDIPSSPIYLHSQQQYHHNNHNHNHHHHTSSSVSLNSSPVKYSYDSIWAPQSSSIWSYTPSYQASNYHSSPTYQYMAQPQPPVFQGYAQQQPYVETNMYQPQGFVGYTNPYYGYNMASC